MKIIIFHQYYLGPNDSGGSRWNQFAGYFSKNNDVVVLAGNIHYSTGKQISPHRLLNKEQISEHLTVYRTWTYSGYNVNFIGRLLGYLSYTFSSFITGLFINKADVIIITSPPLFIGLSALFLSKLKRIPFVFEVRDLWPESAITTGVVKNGFLISIMYKIEKLLYSQAARIVVLTPAFKKDIENRFPKFSNKVQIITNGADLDILKPGPINNEIRKKYNWNGKIVFSYFGAHGLANDLIQIIEVARLFKEDEQVLFALIGDGMQKESLKKKAKEYGLKNIQFIDSIPKQQVNSFINASDVCLAVLKKNDTFKTVYPNKIFDYMACKKPMLVTIDGITRDLVTEAGAGLYAEPGNILEFKNIIDNFKTMPPEKLQKMGENGYLYVKKYFNRDELAKKYFKLISDLL